MHRGLRLSTMIVLIALAASMGRAEDAAILPFANVTPTSVPNRTTLDWIGESVADTIREALMSRGVATFDRKDVREAYRTLRLLELSQISQASAIKLGQTLRADFVMSGTVSYQPPKVVPPPPPPPPPPTPAPAQPGENGAPATPPPVVIVKPALPKPMGTLTIRARISNRRTLQETGILEETGPLEDLATLEAHLAWRAMRTIAPNLAPAEAESRSLRGPVRLDVQENYIRGLLAPGEEQKEKFFQQAAKLDPRFWRPAYELGKIYLTRKEYKQAISWLTRVEPPTAHQREQRFFLGVAKLYDGDNVAAQDIFTALSARYPSAEVFNNLGVAESRRGQMHALESFRMALNANPADADYQFNFGYILWKTGQFEAAADRFRAVLDRVPTDGAATRLLGRALQNQGMQAAKPKAATTAKSTASAKTPADNPTDMNLERIKDSYERMSLVVAGKSGGNPADADDLAEGH